MELPVITNEPAAKSGISCENCGECCMSISSPPGFVVYCRPNGKVPDWAYNPKSWPDADIWREVPENIKNELRAYYAHCEAQVQAGVNPAVAYRDMEPCFWLDLATKKCKHYEHRPVICREFKVGEESCLAYRASVGLPGE